MDAYTVYLELLLLATFVLSLPFFPLCVNYDPTPALWLNYVPVA